MQAYFTNVSFRYPFRDYQKRVLEQIGNLLKDEKLHIVAAPGSGKTVLGLEVIRQLNQKTLILVPTINLRNQWKERFFDLFLPKEEEDLQKMWEQQFSPDLQSPGIVTCATYQALYYLYKEKMEEGEDAFRTFVDTYKEFGIRTICLDEAHHLKQEWWKALTAFVEAMDVKVISLTATPPMDTSDLEWKRYIDLCGDIDLEIFTPEMVMKKCLCPHQDYLYLCKPTHEEQHKVEEELERNHNCQRQILRDTELYQAIKQLPFLIKPSEYTTLLVKYPGYLEHVVCYASYIQKTFQVELEGSMTDAGKAFAKWDYRIRRMVHEKEVPSADEWFLPLMQDILENDSSNYPENLREKLSGILKKNHFLKNGKVSSSYAGERIGKTLLNSAAKLDAIEDIVQTESTSMGKDLRCLILMDHIRKEDLKKMETQEPLTDLGVSTVFERLRRQEHLGNLEKFLEPETEGSPVLARSYKTRIGVLTGSLIILPDPVMEQLEKDCGITNAEKIGRTGYSIWEGNADSSDKTTTAITGYFQRGLIEILIGTAALLGEGWDAPCVNTLIIGSTSSMYVKTNQMRGRALRMDEEHPEKVANVWHLMTVTSPIHKSPEYHAMEQRFEAILGLSMDGTRVENGIGRLMEEKFDLGKSVSSEEYVGLGKSVSSEEYVGLGKSVSSKEYVGLGKSVSSEEYVGLGKSVSSEEYVGLEKSGSLEDGLGYGNFSFETEEGGYSELSQWNAYMKKKACNRAFVKRAWENVKMQYKDARVRNVVVVEHRPDFKIRGGWFGQTPGTKLGAGWFKQPRSTGYGAGWLNKKQLFHVAEVIVKTLQTRKLVHEGVVLRCTQEKRELLFYLEAASEHDSRLFATCMKQVASPLKSPKYMIRMGIFVRRYFAVPDILATRKEIATEFCNKLRFHSKLWYVRSKEGELQLLNEKLRRHTAGKRSVQMLKELI